MSSELEISLRMRNSFYNYLNYIFEYRQDKVPLFFNKWKLFDNYIKNKDKDKTQMITDKEIYITNKIFYQIQKIQKNKRKN